MLCSHRAEGFSTHSSLSSPIPTSCFVDVILVPLPVWVALAAIPVLLVLRPRHLIRQYTAAEPCTRQPRPWLHRAVAALYYILIVCNILMHTLEIVRLSLIHYGIGLLPFAYVGLVVGAALRWSRGAAGKVPAWPVVNMVVWLGGMVMSIVKAVGLHSEGDPRKGSRYPISDQVLDVAVIAGVYGVIAALEIVTGIWRRRRSALSK